MLKTWFVFGNYNMEQRTIRRKQNGTPVSDSNDKRSESQLLKKVIQVILDKIIHHYKLKTTYKSFFEYKFNK